MQQYYYLLIDLACISIPLLFSFHPKLQFHKELKFYLPAMIAVAIFFLIWDEIFTAQEIWGFNETYLTSHKLGHLPIEEILFFICIPYACVFSYFSLKKLIKRHPFHGKEKNIGFFLMAFSATLAILFYDRWYTVITFGLLAAFLFLIKRLNNWKNLPNVVFGYLCILPFFFLSNGILTGSFIEDQIVWYNDAENIGKRMFTIPVEDSFYGFLLIFMNVELYEAIKQRLLKNTVVSRNQ